MMFAKLHFPSVYSKIYALYLLSDIHIGYTLGVRSTAVKKYGIKKKRKTRSLQKFVPLTFYALKLQNQSPHPYSTAKDIYI